MTPVTGIIASQHHEQFSIYLAESGRFIKAGLGGSLRRQLKIAGLSLVVGDRVSLDRASDEGGQAIIVSLAARRSLLSRVSAGGSGQIQALAANVDLVLICTSLNEEFNLRRLERYLALADGAGLPAVIVLTKSDLQHRQQDRLSSLAALNPLRQRLLCSALTGQGQDELKALIPAGQTAVLMGSSGVGKSSLVNLLLGKEALRTAAISRHQDKGRHTTTHRQLIPLPEGGYLIDSPGIRELKLEDSDVSAAFDDVEVLAQGCRFRDCGHQAEPGCAVRLAVAQGQLDAGRLRSYLKLKAEEARRQRHR